MLGLAASTDFSPSGGARGASHFPQRIAAPVLGDDPAAQLAGGTVLILLEGKTEGVVDKGC